MRSALLALLLGGCSTEGNSTPVDTVSECNSENEECISEDMSSDDDEAEEPEAGCGGEGPNMLPGADCLACHADGVDDGEARWTYGGTAFADRDGSEPLEGATIRITDADGQVIEARTNAVGNFYGERPIRYPIHAEIEVDGEVTAMPDAVDSAGCNSCHACDGSAGGKLYAP